MKHAAILDRLAGLGGAKWEIHYRARALAAQGRDVIELTIGEPDVPAPPVLTEVAVAALRAGRTGYSDGRGEAGLRRALAERYSRSAGRTITEHQILCFPGTQTALFALLLGVGEVGAEVLVGDPMYATYEGVIRAGGAAPVPVPLRPERGFRMDAADLAARVTPRSRAILLNSPHNPTGAILSRDDLQAIGEVATAHDLWILSDEVYEDLVFEGAEFVSPLAFPHLADRVVAASSISKSHAMPGMRSGWIVAPADFAARLLPLSETMLFGNQPFIADMTEAAVRAPSPVAAGMRQRFAARARRLKTRLEGDGPLRVHAPQAGMFALIDVRGTGLDGAAFAAGLIEEAGVAVMPGASFGASLGDWVRVALTVDDDRFAEACDRIAAYARTLAGVRA
ncbi:pyridoxal phosphate-dependent aminotransferase [Palleronia sp. KMU-117]|uniref:pyridoxal phosphate-dependent aminotransferase n=1 Tax=Palleronia sp. KMU-117 TaxID=3434108 RepID=UPI003D735577